MSYLLRQSLRSCRTAPFATRQAALRFSTSQRWRQELLSSQRIDFESKYAEKLRKRAEAEGTTVEQLRERAKELEKAKRQAKLSAQPAQVAPTQGATAPQPQATQSSLSAQAVAQQARKDSSPVKSLSSIINVDKILETPHTAQQVSVLWQAYHASRSGGTGRGYLCAAVPVEAYEKMTGVASKYPSFVVAVPRDASQALEPAATEERAYEFYFMEWGFHGAPLELRSSTDIFSKPQPSANPQTATVLYTPLQEYKMRNSFATPYLVLTFYTDLAKSHGIVLLRGEITPSSASSVGPVAGGDGRFMLNQQDAQLLAMEVQKFYLWNEGSGEREALLKTFHENPACFEWKELLKHADFSA